MPRQSKGARLWSDKASGFWFIRDGAIKRSTGCRSDNRAGAEDALRAYLDTKYVRPSDSRASRLFVTDILIYYGREIAPGQKSKATSYAIEPLATWWATKKLSDVKRSTCLAYVEHRRKQPIRQAKTDEARKKKVSEETARRELTVLRAAINAYHEETPLDALPIVTLPPASPPRTRWLTRDEAARLLKAARRLEDKDSSRALVRFILLGLYTGTRSGALRDLGWMPNSLGGWVDLEHGVIHRRGEDEAETKKRKPPIRIPDRLVGSLARWHAADMTETEKRKPIPFVIHYRGKPVDKQRKSWAAALEKAGLPKDITPHILRHTATTWLLHAGVKPFEVASYVGMSVQMVDDVYGHHSPEHQKEIAANIGRKPAGKAKLSSKLSPVRSA
ncbi:tyrosine-type recombinase/integrase [Antarcticirhabdus aurantiaca]|uniref:Site-specific integrase n=1 Tax=Antarcticirhabdus aurantiaca TaxID=2606717 RepID=A0ACD4NLC1_9HYPH|nr:site-specific integrase [Antarcticirhabdus aurantiaca]WAJ27593.1 site-specific integrase [Jeongeuplla avenae]